MLGLWMNKTDRSEKQKSTIQISGERAQNHHEGTIKKMHHKEKKKNATKAAYQEHEAQVYQALHRLVTDTACFQEYTADAYSILQETFQAAHSSFEGGAAKFTPCYGTTITQDRGIPQRVMSPSFKVSS